MWARLFWVRPSRRRHSSTTPPSIKRRRRDLQTHENHSASAKPAHSSGLPAKTPSSCFSNANFHACRKPAQCLCHAPAPLAQSGVVVNSSFNPLQRPAKLLPLICTCCRAQGRWVLRGLGVPDVPDVRSMAYRRCSLSLPARGHTRADGRRPHAGTVCPPTFSSTPSISQASRCAAPTVAGLNNILCAVWRGETRFYIGKRSRSALRWRGVRWDQNRMLPMDPSRVLKPCPTATERQRASSAGCCGNGIFLSYLQCDLQLVLLRLLSSLALARRVDELFTVRRVSTLCISGGHAGADLQRRRAAGRQCWQGAVKRNQW